MILRRMTTKTVGTAPEGGEASPVGFLMKSFKCKYKGIMIQLCSYPPHLSCQIFYDICVIGPAIQLCTYYLV